MLLLYALRKKLDVHAWCCFILVFNSLPASFSSSISRDLMTNCLLLSFFIFNVTFWLVLVFQETLLTTFTRVYKGQNDWCNVSTCTSGRRTSFHDLDLDFSWEIINPGRQPSSDWLKAPCGRGCKWTRCTWNRTEVKKEEGCALKSPRVRTHLAGSHSLLLE